LKSQLQVTTHSSLHFASPLATSSKLEVPLIKMISMWY